MLKIANFAITYKVITVMSSLNVIVIEIFTVYYKRVEYFTLYNKFII